MAISWTLIVLGALLQGMQCNADDSTTTPSVVTTVSSKPTVSSNLLGSITASVTSPTLTTTQSTETATTLQTSTAKSTLTTLGATKTALISSSTDSNTPTAPLTTTITPSTTPTLSVTSKPTSQNGPGTTHITTIQPKTSNTVTTLTPFNSSTEKSTTTDNSTDPKQDNTNETTPATATSTEVVTTQLSSNQTNSSSPTVNKISTSPITVTPDSKSTTSQNPDTTKAQTTASTIRQNIMSSTSTPENVFKYSFELNSTEANDVLQACKSLGQKMKFNCMITHDNRITATITIAADQKIQPRNEQHDGGNADSKDTIPDTLIAILASCGALVLILCCFAAYCTYHRRSYRKNQQHLTEELQTVENGYHDNPTLEVMEVQPEMQEKKLTMNGEFNDSWIVPIDNLLKEDIPDEEDTHL
ncbi:podocalyxin [Puntigrus tetrazona]|uniref:podocalyxin n=1 Tax=Puntigrus tetrazona TaxID=1606681 RepID=UPI001C8AC573|nr:podocalyxin [Puntigrus tetrazona]